MAQTLGLIYKRIQFTPDLMPSDITGTDIIEEDSTTGRRDLDLRAGSDLRQRAAGRRNQPHAAQDAVGAARSHAGAGLHRPRPQLPAALAVLRAGHPEPDRTRRHLSAARSPARPLPVQCAARLPFGGPRSCRWSISPPRRTSRRPIPSPTRRRFWTSSSWSAWCRSANRRRVSPSNWCAPPVRVTKRAPDFVKKYVNYGGSVRAAQFLVLSAKARALMKGRVHVAFEDIRALYIPVLRHRVLLNFHAESDRLTPGRHSAADPRLERHAQGVTHAAAVSRSRDACNHLLPRPGGEDCG